MYSYIYDIKTNRYSSIFSKKGMSILKKYINQIGGTPCDLDNILKEVSIEKISGESKIIISEFNKYLKNFEKIIKYILFISEKSEEEFINYLELIPNQFNVFREEEDSEKYSFFFDVFKGISLTDIDKIGEREKSQLLPRLKINEIYNRRHIELNRQLEHEINDIYNNNDYDSRLINYLKKTEESDLETIKTDISEIIKNNFRENICFNIINKIKDGNFVTIICIHNKIEQPECSKISKRFKYSNFFDDIGCSITEKVDEKLSSTWLNIAIQNKINIITIECSGTLHHKVETLVTNLEEILICKYSLLVLSYCDSNGHINQYIPILKGVKEDVVSKYNKYQNYALNNPEIQLLDLYLSNQIYDNFEIIQNSFFQVSITKAINDIKSQVPKKITDYLNSQKFCNELSSLKRRLKLNIKELGKKSKFTKEKITKSFKDFLAYKALETFKDIVYITIKKIIKKIIIEDRYLWDIIDCPFKYLDNWENNHSKKLPDKLKCLNIKDLIFYFINNLSKLKEKYIKDIKVVNSDYDNLHLKVLGFNGTLNVLGGNYILSNGNRTSMTFDKSSDCKKQIINRYCNSFNKDSKFLNDESLILKINDLINGEKETDFFSLDDGDSINETFCSEVEKEYKKHSKFKLVNDENEDCNIDYELKFE
uniref:Uncharacterized protein n=1 Tax=viral metagenome TaxID=1070528 RepID=A0A6C0IVS2_9ZZZZ